MSARGSGHQVIDRQFALDSHPAAARLAVVERRHMRSRKYRLVTTVERLNNRLTRLMLRKGLAPAAFALLETTGRRTGLPRHTPVGNGRVGDTFWLIAAHGTQADWVRNVVAHPAVRVKIGRSWLTGTAVVLPDDDATARSRTLPHQWDKALGRMMSSSPLTIRIDLDPPGGPLGAVTIVPA
jgi:deazaflavin-dependent oxidoreductase (nitroreductase family)